MAEQAIDGVNPQKHRRQIHRLAIVCVLCGPHRNRVSNRPIRFPVFKAVACGRNQLSRHLVVWLVVGDGIFQIKVKRVSTVKVAIDAAGLRVHSIQIAEKHRPFVDKLRRSNHRIDLGIPLRRIGVVYERNNLRSRRNAAC